MKHLMKFALLLALAAGLVSCDLFNVDVDTTLSGTLDIAVDEPMMKSAADGYPFMSTTTIDPADDPDVEDYIDKIVEVGVDGIIAEVEWVSDTGAAFLTGSTFTISNASETATWTIEEDWPIEVGATLMLEDLGGIYDDVAAILLEMDVFTIGMEGTSSKTGIYATVRIDIDATVTGNPF